MLQQIEQVHELDSLGNPAGGRSAAEGMLLQWQDGPLGRGSLKEAPNGCFVETVIAACMGRLEFYQASQFKCAENAEALQGLGRALKALQRRTVKREAAGVEGTHGVHGGVPLHTEAEASARAAELTAPAVEELKDAGTPVSGVVDTAGVFHPDSSAGPVVDVPPGRTVWDETGTNPG